MLCLTERKRGVGDDLIALRSFDLVPVKTLVLDSFSEIACEEEEKVLECECALRAEGWCGKSMRVCLSRCKTNGYKKDGR